MKIKLCSSSKDSILELVDFPTDAEKDVKLIRHSLIMYHDHV